MSVIREFIIMNMLDVVRLNVAATESPSVITRSTSPSDTDKRIPVALFPGKSVKLIS
jgi:hypothetical protein